MRMVLRAIASPAWTTASRPWRRSSAWRRSAAPGPPLPARVSATLEVGKAADMVLLDCSRSATPISTPEMPVLDAVNPATKRKGSRRDARREVIYQDGGS